MSLAIDFVTNIEVELKRTIFIFVKFYKRPK